MSKKNIKYLMKRELDKQKSYGTSKRSERRQEAQQRGEYQTATSHIHSYQTMQTYQQHADQYGRWLNEHGMGHCSLSEARQMAPEYILSYESTWSQKTARSALAKVFGCAGADLCEIETRRSSDIVRGREGGSERAKAVEAKHPELAEICRSIGLRHNRELTAVTLDQFKVKNGELYCCNIVGKGGRVRDALVVPGRGRDLILERIKSGKPADKLVDTVPKGANVHGFRADYAARCYSYAQSHGMASGHLYRSEIGVYDKGCLAFVSKNLGHGPDRFHTVVHNYLSYGKA